MQTTTGNYMASLLGMLGLSVANPNSAGIIIGAFAGSIVFMLRAKKLSRVERAICTPVAFLMGVYGHRALSQFSLIPEPVAAAVVAVGSILVLQLVIWAIETDDFKTWLLSRLTGGKK